ncbi:MAG: S8 family peptidase [Oligoflexia bacterium]|nr:S8 family peptidase [Oligoflexia bacterium]
MKNSNLIHLVLVLSILAAGCSKNRPTQKEENIPINAKGDLLGQEGEVENWFTKSPDLDLVEGTQADRTYVDFNLKTDVAPIIVAVIDSGVDVKHEDLQGQIWVNEDEVPGNGLDDDKNGFVDDVNGWNFLGSYDKSRKPINIDDTTLEVTRELVAMKKLKAQREAQGLTLSESETKYLQKLDAEVSEELKVAKESKDRFEPEYKIIKASYEILKPLLNNVELKDLTLKLVSELSVVEVRDIAARDAIVASMDKLKVVSVARLLRLIARADSALNVYYNENFDPRKVIIGDDPSDFNDRNYGNNDLLAGDANHGTHVSGIIAAVRNNNLGINGIATNVKIMVLRAVPNGDEYDKDVANSVRYAVDNGARIVTMSFGKAYSPYKEKVDEAFRYAAAKNVLIVHAAGNSSLNTDIFPHFPNKFMAQSGAEISTFLDVGANSEKKGLDLPAVFTNYGQSTVDIFAPGVNLKSTVVGSLYATYSGTSMATPCVTGVAALVLSQYPDLSALELKAILKNSARTYPDLIVNLPGALAEPLKVLFRKLSETGGIVDTFEALKLAASRQ